MAVASVRRESDVWEIIGRHAAGVPTVLVDGVWCTVDADRGCFVNKESGAMIYGGTITEIRLPISESLTIGAQSNAGSS